MPASPATGQTATLPVDATDDAALLSALRDESKAKRRARFFCLLP